MRSSRRRLLHLTAAAVVIAGGLLLRIPSPEYFLMDPDGGVQLAAAQQIRLTGEQPWIDFYVPYGPLVYYLSFLGLWLSGDRLVGEIALSLAGYGVAYLSLFVVTLRRTGSPAVAWSLLGLLLLLVPRYYKYFVVLAPALGLVAVTLSARSRGVWRALALGAVTAVAFALRLDLGVFVLAAAACALLADTGLPIASRVRLVGAALLATAALLVPWLALVAWRGELGLVLEMVRSSVSTMPSSLSRPHPFFSWHYPRLSVLYAAATVPAIAAAFLLVRRWPGFDREARVVGAGALGLGFACLTITASRTDMAHLLQGIPLGFVAFAILAGPGGLGRAARSVVIAGWLGMAFTAAAAVKSLITGPEDRVAHTSQRSLAGVARSLEWACRPTASALADVRERRPELASANLAHFLSTHTAPGDRVVVWPFASQVVFFSERAFAGRTTVALSGHFDSPGAQRRVIAALEQQQPQYVLWDEDFALDGRPERRPTATAAQVHGYVRRHWQLVDRIGRHSVFRLAPTVACEVRPVDEAAAEQPPSGPGAPTPGGGATVGETT